MALYRLIVVSRVVSSLFNFARQSLYSASCTSHCIRTLRNIIIRIGGCSIKAILAQMDNSCTLLANVELHYAETSLHIYNNIAQLFDRSEKVGSISCF